MWAAPGSLSRGGYPPRTTQPIPGPSKPSLPGMSGLQWTPPPPTQPGGYDHSGYTGGMGPRPGPFNPVTGRPNIYDPNRGLPPGAQSFGETNQNGVFGNMQRATNTQMPAGGAYGNPAQGGYITGAGTGDRRYYDTQMNNLMSSYQKGAGGLQDLYNKRVTDLNNALAGYGNQQLADARQAGQNLQSSVLGGLDARGLGNSTLLGAGAAMANTNTQNNINRINEQLQNQKVGLMERTTGDALGYGQQALNYGTNLGQSNIAASRGNYENDRNFGEGQFQSDRNFGRGTYENDRNFNQGVYQDARDFANQNYNLDRSFNYNAQQDQLANQFRNRNFDYQQYLDALNRGDRIKLQELGFMADRTDQYPDLGTLLQLSQGLGQGNYAY